MVEVIGMSETRFSSLVDLCTRLQSTKKRTEKRSILAEFLRRLSKHEISPAVLLLAGSVFAESDDSHVLQIGGSLLSKVMHRNSVDRTTQSPSISEVYATLESLSRLVGNGSRKKKEQLLGSLFRRLEPDESDLLVRLIFGEPRTGVAEGILLEGIAGASETSIALVTRASMLIGDLGRVAELALTGGTGSLEQVRLELFRPVKPMLAEMSYDLAEVISSHGGSTALEFKFDGARVQVHRDARAVRLYSRRLSDVTDSLPDVVETVLQKTRPGRFILDGEVVAIGANNRPLPFQDLMRRFGRVHEVPLLADRIPLQLHVFDIIYLEDRELLKEEYASRRQLLETVCEQEILATRTVTGAIEEAQQFLEKAIDAGHEGLMAKRLDSDYSPGIRGKKWFKVKPAETLDLVIVGADWGYGRRIGWLSNYHLAALDKDTGEYMMLGKTFKGLTDEEFIIMTERLKSLKTDENEYSVIVEPSVVVEVGFNEIQRSPRYKSGFALRFARITRIREDKSPQDTDDMGKVRHLYESQFRYKSRVGR